MTLESRPGSKAILLRRVIGVLLACVAIGFGYVVLTGGQFYPAVGEHELFDMFFSFFAAWFGVFAVMYLLWKPPARGPTPDSTSPPWRESE